MLVVKDPSANAGDTRDTGSIAESGRTPWRRKWQATPVFLPGESHGHRGLVGYSPWGRKESNIIEHSLLFVSYVAETITGTF